MLIEKSVDILARKSQLKLLLEVNKKGILPKALEVFPQRIKKLQENGPARKSRTIKLLQNLELQQLEKNQPSFSTISREKLEKNHKISSYLIYKKQQQNLRANHNFKLLHLRSKCLESRHASKKSAQSQLSNLSRTLMKKSNSKVNLIVVGLSQPEDKQVKSPPAKSRSFYIKTSQGKKQKLSTIEYQKKLKQKIESKGQSTELLQHSNEFSLCAFLTNYSQSQESQKHHSCNTMRKKFNIKRKANSLSSFNHDRSSQFRPWSANKSEIGQQ